MRFGRGTAVVATLVGMILLAGCDTPPVPSTPAAPRPAPPAPTEPSAASKEIASHFQRVQSALLTQGLLRTDGGGPDVPFNARTLVRDFLAIALFQEYSETAGHLVAGAKSSTLHRWAGPVRYHVANSATVPEAQRQRDSDTIRRYAARLGRLTGLSFSEVSDARANYHIFIVNEDERQALGAKLRAIEPGISAATLDAAVNMPRDTYCLAFASESGTTGLYDRGIVIIRAEHPDLLRTACVHEELAQSLGLANDSPRARPSIFNDDSEFGFLTTHDEMLLRILYDPRLTPGMTEAQARPIVETIAAELMGGAV